MNETPNDPGVIESPARDPLTGFDLRVVIKDARTNKVIRTQPYLRHSDRNKGVVYERDGKFYHENGKEAKNWAPTTVDEDQVQQQAKAQVHNQRK